MFNTLPYNSFPASTAKFEEGKNDAIQAEIDAMKDGTNIDSFGDVETALATKTNLSNIAPTFEATSGVYEIGDKVIYDGVLYEFTSDHSTAGEWDESEVQPTKISELIDTLKSGLTNLIVSDIKSSVGQTVAAGDDAMFTIDVTKQGYTPIFYTAINTSNSRLVPYYYSLSGNTLSVAVHNYATGSLDGTVSALVLYRHS